MYSTLRLIGSWGVPAVLLAVAAAPTEAQTWRTMTSARQVWDQAPIEVDIEYGAGRLTVTPADSPMLYEMEVRYDEGMFRPVAEFDTEDRRLELGVESIRNDRRVNVREGSTARIGLTREVPLDLDLEFGAGQADIELGGVSLRSLALSTGASETTVTFSVPNPTRAERITIEAGAADLRVMGLGNTRAERVEFKGGVGATVLDFSGNWQGSAVATVEMGIGSVTLQLPRSHGVRLDRRSFLTSFSAPGMERRGESYYSSNWESSENRLTLEVSAALGSIDIHWVD